VKSTENNKLLKRKSFISAMSLFFQSGYSAVLGFIANLILTILLSPSIFGIYITVLSLISFLNYFSDVGLAASLIQKKELTDDDIKTTFTAQQILILSIILIGFVSTSFIKKFYNLPDEGTYLYWALLFSFFISSLKTIPSVFLERKIEFQKIVLVQVVENSVFYITVSVLAILGFGLFSFTYSVILRSLIGLVMIYSLSFWIPKIGISFKSLKKLLSFGLPFQASSFLALFKDDLIILYLGKVLGFQALGLIGFAKKWAEAPIRIIMDNISRVIFPLIAKAQNDLNKVKNYAEKILYYQTLVLAPIIIGMMLVMPRLIEIIPKYQKWQPALPLFYIFAFSSLIVSFSAPFMNLLNGLGKVKITFSFMIFFTILTWLLTPWLTNLFDSFGFPISHIVVSSFYLLVLFKTKSIFKLSIMKPILSPLTSSILMGIILFSLDKTLIYSSWSTVLFEVLLGTLIYYVLIRYVFKVKVVSELQSIYGK
jgi:PST family polysaccharide transporter